jgi:glycerol-3-phosphate dehydrogenase
VLQSHVRGEAARRDRQEEEVEVVGGACGEVSPPQEVVGPRDVQPRHCGVRPVLRDGETEDALFDRVNEWFQARMDLVWEFKQEQLREENDEGRVVAHKMYTKEIKVWYRWLLGHTSVLSE